MIIRNTRELGGFLRQAREDAGLTQAALAKALAVRRQRVLYLEAGEGQLQLAFVFAVMQSVGVNFRYAFTHPDRVRGVVAICGGIPGDWEQPGKYAGDNLDVLCVAAERDEFYTPERMRQNAEALKSRAHSVELRLFDAKHEVPREAYPVIDGWLRQQAGI